MAPEVERVGTPERSPVEPGDHRSRVAEWFLLTGDRILLVAGILFGLLVVIVGLFAVDLIAVTDSDALTRSFAALVGGNLTLITIVVAINQLILSREFGTPDELRDRIEEMQPYRREAEETAEVTISPITPDDFIDFLVRTIRDHAITLRKTVAEIGTSDRQLEAAVERYVETLVAQTDRTMELSQEPPTEAFHALVVVLKTDFTASLHVGRELQSIHGNSLPAAAAETLDELIELIEFIGVLRQYLETLYLQRELALFSRRLFYLGLPAVALPLLMIWVYGQQPGAAIDGLALRALVTVTGVVAFAPLALFFAYIVRIATITRRTAALMPFKSGGRELG